MATDNTFEQFHRLIKKGDLIRLKEFVDSGADVNLRNRFAWTPLMLAASEGQTPLVSFLLSAGADVHAVNDFGASALAYAALHGECKTIQALLAAGASVDVQPHGVSLLDFAGWGDGRFKTRKHFDLLQKAGAA
jgi:ankyrin repeat protein